MQYSLKTLPREIKILLMLCQIAMVSGFLLGLGIIDNKSNFKPQGVYQQYNGNEEEEDAKVLLFRKSKFEILITVHTHLLSLSILFLVHGLLVFGAEIKGGYKKLIMWEPMISLLVTFLSIYLLWSTQVMFWSYLAVLSGILMTLTFLMGQTIVFYQLIKK